MARKELRQLRQDLQYSQAFVAEQLSVSQSLVSRWESGQRLPNLHEAKRLAMLLEIDVDDMLSCFE